MRIALFGGSFDPVHRGHVSIARAAADGFGLDRVLFAPVGRQPLKLEDIPAPFADRLAMAALACEADGRFAVSDLDAPRADGRPNYTVDSLAALRSQMPAATLFVLVGADSFLNLRRWRDSERLLELAEWIVVSRPGFALSDLTGSMTRGPGLSPREMDRVHVLDGVQEEVSATDLRQRLRRGDDCGDLLSEAVAEYIHLWGLYHPQSPTFLAKV